MKGFETQNGASDSVDKWTLQQCEEHLKKYPKGFIADQARARIKKLQPSVATKKKEETKPSSNEGKIPPTNIFNGKQTGQTTSSSSTNYKKPDDSIPVILKLLATIVCIGMFAFAGYAMTQHVAFISVTPLFYFAAKWLVKLWEK